MTSPIEEQQNRAVARGVRAEVDDVPFRDWCCGTRITRPHAAGCAYEPGPELGAAGHRDHVHLPPTEAVSEPPSAPTPAEGPVSAAASSVPAYGFKKAAEEDLDLPSGGRVRIRRLRKMQVIDLKLMDILDGFGPELLKDIRGDDPVRAERAQEEAARAFVDPETSDKVFGPVNRVVAAAVVCPRVVLDGPSTDEQINASEIEIEDKMAIFNAALPNELKSAALGEQLAALKSVRNEPDAGV
ncbi:DUF7391 family protein [Mycobacterium aquaticum]|uniref:Uncharacterized protein n=1 Tax=Mycobacterium aquaticum TaxID=1927124 RepID=A0A1X0A597_9MYCO|nr:hypothetical protein [Mycobacterium aquaticum]ORA25162.1 hypothetical protein BST13_33100 [Mycobacterium aquaticum]